MAITFDAVGTGNVLQTSGTTVTWTHTVGALTNGVLVASTKAGGSATLNNLVFAGQNLTKFVAGTSQTAMALDVWYLVNPPSGLGTFNGTWTAGGGNSKQGVSMSYAGVDQVSPLSQATINNPGLTTSTSGSVTTSLAPNNWFVGFDGLTISPGTTTIGNERGTATQAGASNELLGADSTGGTLNWTNTAARIINIGASLNFPSDIVFDSFGSGTAAGSAVTSTHTVVSNTNGYFLAWFSQRSSSTGTILASPKFAGQNMTLIRRGTTTESFPKTIELWGLLAPPTGLGTLNGTWAVTVSANQGGQISMAYKNVNQTTPIVGSFIGTSAAIATGTIADTTLSSNNRFVGGAVVGVTPGTTTVGVERGTVNPSSMELLGVDSNGGTLQWSFSASSQALAGLGVELGTVVPVVSNTTYTTFMTLMGAGNI